MYSDAGNTIQDEKDSTPWWLRHLDHEPSDVAPPPPPASTDETPAGPPADLLALFPNVPTERWKRIPASPGTTGGWKVSTGEKDKVPVTETLRRIQTPERMILAQAIEVSVERARKAREGSGPVHAGRPDPALAERYEQQARELRRRAWWVRRPAEVPASSPLPRRTPTPRPTARRPAARRSLGARSSSDPGGSDGDEPSQAGWRYSPERYRLILGGLSERVAAKGAAAEGFKETRTRSEAVLEALERAQAEGRRLSLEEALDAAVGGEHVGDQWWGSTAQLVNLLWWANFPFGQMPEGVITHCPACIRGPLFAVERRPDHAELTCAHGCAEPTIRKKFKELEALAPESLDGGVAR